MRIYRQVPVKNLSYQLSVDYAGSLECHWTEALTSQYPQSHACVSSLVATEELGLIVKQ